MSGRYTRPISVLLTGLLAVVPAASQEPLPLPPAIPVPHAEPGPESELVRQWLDEVRAQRQAREERRRSDKEARDARRRWIDPWGAAQREAREEENRRRRDAFMDHIERDREGFRNLVPWGFHPDPWQEEAAGIPAETPLSTGTDAATASQQVIPHPSSYPLPGWDNRWYYRGF